MRVSILARVVQQPGAILDNRYEVISHLGNGSYGEVYEVRDHHQGQVVALKLLDPTKLGSWPWNEPTQLTRLRSDFVLPVWNASTAAGIPYVVTDLATGGTVEDAVASHPMVPSDAILTIRHAARGTSRTHDERIVHRDIKPANLFVSANGRVQLGDFGLAHPMNDAGEAPGAGTPATQAPEVITGGVTSVSSDVYSLGASLYRLLTGSFPYLDQPRPTRNDLEAAVRAGPPTSVRDLAQHVSRGLAAVVERAIERSPASRQASAAELDAALGRLRHPERSWQLLESHDGHERCWETRDGVSGIAVCVIPSGRGGEILVRNSPSGRRILKHCQRVTRSRLASKLRKIFEDLGN